MNDKIYESVKWIAIGILIGYFGKYALNWLKTKQSSPEEEEEKISFEGNQ